MTFHPSPRLARAVVRLAIVLSAVSIVAGIPGAQAQTGPRPHNRLVTIGNLVWIDANDNGVVDPGEVPVDGVDVSLYRDNGNGLFDPATDTIVGNAITLAGGQYQFSSLPEGAYFVQIPASEFHPGQPLARYRSSTGQTTADINNRDHGAAAGGLGIVSHLVTLTAGAEPTDDGDGNADTNLTIDFGFTKAGLSLGNLVWLDVNDNGLADPGEPGLAGVTVRLIGGDGITVLATTTTDANGHYGFANLVAGSYFVDVPRTGPIAGYRSALDLASSASPNSDVDHDDNGVTLTPAFVRSGLVTLTAGAEPVNDGDGDANTNLTVDFGFLRALSIGNLVWSDVNDNGLADAGETGLSGVTVRLVASNGLTVLATTTTDPSGHYLFGGLTPGTYFVEVVPPAGATSSTDIATSATPNNDVDHDDNGVTSVAGAVRSGPITLGIGTEPVNDGDTNADSNLTVDFGFRPAGTLSLGNLVWLDLNDNGLAEPGEPGLPGVAVRLLAGNGVTLLAATTTSAAGQYLFTGLAAGAYIVEIDRGGPLAGYLSTVDVVTSANPDTDVDNDDNGVTVTATTVRSGVVTLTLGTEPVNDGDTNPDSNLTVDFGFVRALSVGNLVWADGNNNGVVDAGEPGLAGVTVRLVAANGVTVLGTTTTDAAGHYLFGGLPPGTYFVDVVPPPGATSSTDIATSATPNNDVDHDDNGVTIAGGAVRSGPITLGIGTEPVTDGDANPDSNLTVDFGFVPAGQLSLGNLVWLDLNRNGLAEAGEPGVAGVTVRLVAADGTTVIATTATDGTGRYLFTGLTTGAYLVEVDRGGPLADHLSTTDLATSVNPDTDVDNDDNGVSVTATTVRSGVVTLTPGGEPTTDGDADASSNLTVDFGFVPPGLLSLGNLVWLDLNSNGLADAGEPGLAGVPLRLIAADGVTVLATTATDATGRYLFPSLQPGSYYVEVDRTGAALTGYLSSPDVATSATPDSDVDNDDNGIAVTLGAVRSGVITLTAGGEPTSDGDLDADSNLTVDFGFVRALSVGNLVWADGNNNGVVDAGEPGLAGVTVRLVAANGVTVLGTTTTDATGHYLFGGLPPGTYFVEVVPPPGATSSTDIATSPTPNNDVDHDDNGVTIAGGAVRSGPITLGIGTEPVTDGDANPDSNLTVDFGFVPAGQLSLGNLVWLDTNSNGLADAGEPGLAGVTVRLLGATGDTVLSTTTTSAAGLYLFTALPPGTYRVEVDRTSGPLAGYASSPDVATSAAPDNDVNDDDNGVVVTATAVRSGPVTLTINGEPVNDGDTDDMSNLTVDFGFVRMVSLGNLVWADFDDDGVVDVGEPGIRNVVVRLLGADGTTVLATTTTDARGRYGFGGLTPGTYLVEAVTPRDMRSSTDIAGSETPNNDRDNDDNGVDVGATAVRSRAVTLNFGTEPVNDGDTNPDSNLSIDFGFWPLEGFDLQADICLQQAVPTTVIAGGTMTATYTAENRGPGPAFDVMIDGMLPAGVSVVSSSPSAGGACSVTSDMLVCRWPGVTPAGVNRSVSVVFRVSPTIPRGTPIMLWFMAESTNPDPYPACDMVDGYIFVTGGDATPVDLVIASSTTGGTVLGSTVSASLNQPVSTRFTVTNTGAAAASGRYALLLDEVGVVQLTSATWSQGWAGISNATAGTWETGLIPPGGSALLNLTLVPRTGGAARLQAIRIEGSAPDPDARNDSAEVVIDAIGSGGGRYVATGNLDAVAGAEIVTGAGVGETPQVRVFTGAGVARSTFFAFDRQFRGGVRVATCDINSDGIDELVAGMGPGGNRVRVLSLASNAAHEVVAFDAFEPGFTGGVNVACGDVDGDGFADVVVGPEGGRAPDVRVFSVGVLSASVAMQFQAYEPTFRGGVRVAVGRFAGSALVGAFNIATTPGPGRAMDVRTWQAGGASVAPGVTARLSAATTGARVAIGDADASGGLDLILMPDDGATALLQAWSLSTGAMVVNLPPGTAGYRGVDAATGVLTGGPGVSEVVVARGPGQPAVVSVVRFGPGAAITPRLTFSAAEVP